MTILSLASSKSCISTMRLPRRAANSAASLTRLARSAPEKPGVPRASTAASTSSEHRHLAQVHAHDLLAAADVGQADIDLAVETARAQQRLVEHVGTVGGGDHDHARVGLEAVHLDQHLVQRLFALVVAAAHAGAAMATDRVDFIDEHDAGRVLLGLLEHVAHAGRTHADEHFHEVRTRDAEERHLGLARDGARQQRLAGTRGADQQHAARECGRPASGTSGDHAGNRPAPETSSLASSQPATSEKFTALLFSSISARATCRTRRRRLCRRPASVSSCRTRTR